MGKICAIFWGLLLLLGCEAILAAKGDARRAMPDGIKLPAGFKIGLYADSVPNARSLALGDDGTVYVGTMQEGKVYALKDEDGDGRADKTYTLATGLYLPNGVAFSNGALYVAEVNRILRYDAIAKRLDNPPEPVVVYAALPRESHHGWKYLRFGPDGMLYIPVGVPCNICDPANPIYGTLNRVGPDGGGFKTIARGIRNSVGFDWHPETGEIYFTDNGRDYLGDDAPPDELNRAPEAGLHFGYPYCHGGAISDPEYGHQRACEEFTAPAWRFPAHVAALGMRFYRGEQFPSHYRHQLFIAQHGSWNRSEPVGYRVVVVRFEERKPVSEEVFADGWLTKNGTVLGRPVDILELMDGSLLVSDDARGVIYRIFHQPGKAD